MRLMFSLVASVACKLLSATSADAQCVPNHAADLQVAITPPIQQQGN